MSKHESPSARCLVSDFLTHDGSAPPRSSCIGSPNAQRFARVTGCNPVTNARLNAILVPIAFVLFSPHGTLSSAFCAQRCTRSGTKLDDYKV